VATCPFFVKSLLGGGDFEVFMREILLLTATAFEQNELAQRLREPVRLEVAGRHWLCGHLGTWAVRLVQTGMGAVNAAHALTCALQDYRPDWVLQVGVGGAYPGSGLEIGDVAVASEEVYGDVGVRLREGWKGSEEIGIPLLQKEGDAAFYNRFPLDPEVVGKVERILVGGTWQGTAPVVRSGTFVTVQECSGTAAMGREREQTFGGICENMEGAAAAHLCRLYGVDFVEVRGISNRVEERDKEGWDLLGAGRRGQEAALLLLAGEDWR